MHANKFLRASAYFVSIFFLMCAGRSALALPPAKLEFSPVADLGAGQQEDFSPVSLRGYGNVSGTSWRFAVNNDKASALLIACENEDKAKLLHAKFISDLGILPGVKSQKIKSAGGDASAWAVDSQGAVCALRSGSDVMILSASNPQLLQSLLASVKGDRSGFVYEPQVQVPMWLDRWDKFGFRAYNGGYDVPQGKNDQTYDYNEQFNFMEKNGRTGAVIVTAVSALDTSEGMMREPYWDWLAIATKQHLLPLGFNLNFGPQTWLANRYRDQMAQKMPQYSGGFYRIASTGYPGGLGGEGWLSWSATTAQDEALADVQKLVRRYNDFPNVTTWLEPHGELRHGDHDIFLEYGPVADVTFRSFLKEKYKTVEAVSARWGDTKVKSWDDVKVPEIASFLGWGPQAMDLTGEWKILSQDAPKQPSGGGKAAPYPPFNPDWYSPKFDDSKAVTITAPGNDQMMFVPRQPAVYRRKFDVSADWKNKNGRVFLYVWDLNGNLHGGLNDKKEVTVSLNGKRVAASPIVSQSPHWVGVDVSDVLVAGGNDLAIGVPQGYLAYRIYLSPDAPAEYPNLGKEKNALWADFSDWQAYTRLHSFRRGAEMIREVDPNRQIIFMSPSPYYSAIKELCEDFGGEIHDTGGMAGNWHDANTMYSSGSNLPSSVEPGSAAGNVKDYRLFMARWMTEGTLGIDYFISLNDLMLRPDVRKEFEATQNMVHLVGKYNIPKAETAIWMSDRAQYLTLYPWGAEPDPQLSDSVRIEGYDRWSVSRYLLPLFTRDGLSDSDFARGNAAKYKVIIDANSSIIDDDQMAQIEKYVRDGGVFVTFVQTGRSTSTEFNTWPISKLTGYEVTHIDPHDRDGNVKNTKKLKLAPGQDVFSPDYWKSSPAGNGLSLRKVADDCQNLMMWDDGSVAIGMRPLGKGFIIQVGPKFCGERLGDGAEQTTRLFSDILDYFKIQRIPASVKDGMLRHFVSNNGLYDVWLLANFSDKPITTNLIFTNGLNPVGCLEVQTASPVQIDRSGKEPQLKNLKLEPGTMRGFLTPRSQIDAAPRDWFALQRNWWRGTTKPTDPPLAAPQMKLARELTQDWKFLPIESKDTDIAAMTKPDFDDAAWTTMRVGVWNFPDHPKVHHAMFRRKFTVPAEWTAGRVALWLQSWSGTTFLDRGRVYVDGELIQDWSDAGVADNDLKGLLKPGTTHTIAVEIEGKGVLNGARGDCWIAYLPDPVSTTDLAGEWSASQDALHFNKTLKLPGAWDAYIAKRTVKIDSADATNKNVVLHVDTDTSIVGVLVNGHFVRRHHHMIGQRFDLNITPWIRPGEENDLQLVTWERPSKGNVKDISLRFYDPAVYP